jgi:circadian clock protein KaiB
VTGEAATSARRAGPEGEAKTFVFRLFVAGRGGISQRAVANLDRLRRAGPAAHSRYEVIDVFERPDLAETHRVLATPTLILDQQSSPRRVVGDLSDLARVRAGLDLPSEDTQEETA